MGLLLLCLLAGLAGGDLEAQVGQGANGGERGAPLLDFAIDDHLDPLRQRNQLGLDVFAFIQLLVSHLVAAGCQEQVPLAGRVARGHPRRPEVPDVASFVAGLFEQLAPHDHFRFFAELGGTGWQFIPDTVTSLLVLLHDQHLVVFIDRENDRPVALHQQHVLVDLPGFRVLEHLHNQRFAELSGQFDRFTDLVPLTNHNAPLVVCRQRSLLSFFNCEQSINELVFISLFCIFVNV